MIDSGVLEHALGEEGCLDRNRWTTQGILGRILERVRSEFLSSSITTTTAGLPQMNPTTTTVIHAQPMYNTTPLYSYSAQQQLNVHQGVLCPPPVLNHPMVTIAQQPNAFKPTSLPVTAAELDVTGQLQSTPDGITESSITATVEATNRVESMDAQA